MVDSEQKKHFAKQLAEVTGIDTSRGSPRATVDVLRALGNKSTFDTAAGLMIEQLNRIESTHTSTHNERVLLSKGMGGLVLVSAAMSRVDQYSIAMARLNPTTVDKAHGFGLHGTPVSKRDVYAVAAVHRTGDSLREAIGMVDEVGGNMVGAVALINAEEGQASNTIAVDGLTIPLGYVMKMDPLSGDLVFATDHEGDS